MIKIIKNNMNFINKKNWKKIKLNLVSTQMTPKKSGVYVILDVKKWVQNIPIGIEIIYIGKGNLRRRFLDHVSIVREHNFKLANNIINKKLEFWFLETGAEVMDEVETLLIDEVSEFDPTLTNILKRKKLKIGDHSHVR